ncbi:MAG TPA: LPXTG cell wall anchor domain-containing protein [Candidatus Saccharimonadia bacterium]|jgi:LPXTG-motif cell wall-anchored protein
MYGNGQVLGSCTIAGGAAAACTTVLPQTGMSSATHVAVAAAAGLATWAVVYMAQAMFKR